MLSMSNQFYNYIAEELIKYWQQNAIQKGNRYFFRLDTPEEVKLMVDALKTVNPDIVESFSYEHKDEHEPRQTYETYETFSLAFNQVKLVVAHTNEQVKTDYLALIRNLVSDQHPDWKDTALISIVSEQLDTIPGGSLDVQSEGMPLNPKMIYSQLHQRIQESSLNKAEKLILADNLDRIIQDYQLIKLSIFEFEEILTTIYKGQINQEDYKELGLFVDQDLATFSVKNTYS